MDNINHLRNVFKTKCVKAEIIWLTQKMQNILWEQIVSQMTMEIKIERGNRASYIRHCVIFNNSFNSPKIMEANII